jgi:hypothetical protein
LTLEPCSDRARSRRFLPAMLIERALRPARDVDGVDKPCLDPTAKPKDASSRRFVAPSNHRQTTLDTLCGCSIGAKHPAPGVLSHARLDRSAELPRASVNLDCDSICRATDGIGLIDARKSTSGGTSEASASLPLSRTKPPAVRSCPTAFYLK